MREETGLAEVRLLEPSAPATFSLGIDTLANMSAAGDAVFVEGRPCTGQIGILGPVELLGDGPVPLGGVKERCLLAALSVHCGEAVSVASLVDALWGDDPPRTATKTLQNYVLRVRRALARAEAATIATLPDGYCLRAAPDATDAGLAERLIAAGRRGMAGGDPAAAARLLGQALDLWRGSALGEFADRPFAAAEAMRLEELREAALEDLFDAELALGHHHEVVGGLEALVTSGPLRERRWGQLMLALYRDGRQAEALDAFGRLRQILAQEMGVDPGAELRRLHQAILQQSPRLVQGPNLPGLMCAGGMAELFKTTVRAVVKLPAGVQPAEVAALADAFLTAYHAVRKAVTALGPGSSAVAVGAGGLGHIGIQCLKAMTAAQVIAVDTSEEALKLALSCGADHAVIADGDQAQQVRDLTSSGADAVFDFVGEDPTIGDSVAMLRPGGTYYLVGYGGTVTLPTIQLVLGEITVAGNLIGTNPDLTDLIALAQRGKVVLRSTGYPLDAANEVIDDLRHGRIRGRVAMTAPIGPTMTA
ncbi:MAG: BTAD domain-containing putative transcriptional regulator [Streptosporangiaceae bacterium]